MLRVPGSSKSLLDVKAAGADVRIVYSPLDAVKLARSNPSREVVFFAVGFETTAPANAMAVWQAEREGIRNFSVLVAHVLVPPAMEAILGSPNCRIQGFLAAGHVCTVMGWEEYEPISRRWHVPIVVTGFEPLDLLEGVQMAVAQLEEAAAPRWKTSTGARCARRATGRRSSGSPRYSKSLRGSGAASVKFRRAVCGCASAIARSMRESVSLLAWHRCRGTERMHRAAWFCRA